jgi:hypothetical protein
MIQATIYDDQGRVIGCFTASSHDMLMPNLESHNWIEGSVPPNHYIVNGQAVAMPPCPDTADLKHCWDYDHHVWIIDVDATQKHIRQQRNQLLQVVDQVNPVWYASLDSEQQQQLQQYRQLLLAVPQQPGFPESVEWPAKPTWL